MELRHLRYFVAVAEELHFGRAALRLNISQPPLSQQIKSLEEELCAELFKRSSRRVELTPAGKVFLVRARNLLSMAEDAADEARRVAAGLEGVLRLGFVTPAMDGPLPRVIAGFRGNWPGVRLDLKEASTVEQLEALRGGRLDIGFIRAHGGNAQGLAARSFLREPYVLALPRGHALTAGQSVSLAELDGQPFIFFARQQGPGLHDEIMAAFSRAGAAPFITQEVLSKRSTLALVAAGLGLALVPASTARASMEEVVFRRLREELPLVCVDAAWHPAADSPLVDNFLQAMDICQAGL